MSIEPNIFEQDDSSSKLGQARSVSMDRDDFDRNVWNVLGIPIDVIDVDGAVAAIDRSVREKQKLSFVTPNINWLVRALKEKTARSEVLRSDLSLVDGAPLFWIGKLRE